MVPPPVIVDLLGQVRTTGSIPNDPCGRIGERGFLDRPVLWRTRQALERLSAMNCGFEGKTLMALRVAVLAVELRDVLGCHLPMGSRAPLWVLWEWMRYGGVSYHERTHVWGLLLGRSAIQPETPTKGEKWWLRLSSLLPPGMLDVLISVQTDRPFQRNNGFVPACKSRDLGSGRREQYRLWCDVEGIGDDDGPHLTRSRRNSGRLWLLVGMPGSGKSYWVSKRGVDNVVSMDNLRREIVGNEADQSKNSLIFEIAMGQLKARLERCQDVIYDATNVTIDSRKTPLRIARQTRARVSVVLFDTPFLICAHRNACRERRVPVPALVRFGIEFEPPLPYEYDRCRVISHRP